MGVEKELTQGMTKLKAIIERELIGVVELARRAGLDENTVRRALQGRGAPRAATQRKLLAAVNAFCTDNRKPPLGISDLF
jgi:DNA-binding phage protein